MVQTEAATPSDRRLAVQATGTTRAPRARVWELVADANRYPDWGPWQAGGYDPPAPGPSMSGMRPVFRLGRTTSHERILEVDQGSRVVYTVERGIPVRSYRAEIVLTDTADGGTRIDWSATWDRTLLGRLVHRKLDAFYPDMVAMLVRVADAATNDS
jgi:uncharacterized protein YndB with AHSA1/START domain